MNVHDGAPRSMLPHELLFARFILKRQETNRTSQVIETERKYGERGIYFYAASMIETLLGGVATLIGAVVPVLAGLNGNAATVSYTLFFVGVTFGVIGLMRALQAKNVAKGRLENQ